MAVIVAAAVLATQAITIPALAASNVAAAPPAHILSLPADAPASQADPDSPAVVSAAAPVPPATETASPTEAVPGPDSASPPSTVDGPVAAGDTPSDQAGATAAEDQGNMIVVTGRPPSKADPLEVVNVEAFAAAEAVDGAVVAPVAKVYEEGIPAPIRDGFHNFLGNLHEPVVAVNFLLQHRVGKAAETVGRFAVNTVVGLAGLFDIAKRKPINLPHRANGFADTMGFYGVKPGAFMFLPIIGPTTVRDLAGFFMDRAALPLAIKSPLSGPAYTVPAAVVHSIDKRARNEDRLEKIRDSDDPYRTMRESYLKARQDEIDALHSGKAATADAD